MTVKTIGTIPLELVSPVAVDKSFGFPKNWKKSCYSYDGVVDNEDWDKSTPGFSRVVSIVERAGYRRRQCRGYGEVSFARVQGSAKFHEDRGYGLVASCLIWHSETDGRHDAIKRLYDNEPELITLKGFVSVDVGDVFIFNADNYHAWLNNGISILAQITIAKQKND